MTNKNLIPLAQALLALRQTYPALSRETVRKAIRTGRLKGEKIWGRWFVDVRSLDRFTLQGGWAQYNPETRKGRTPK